MNLELKALDKRDEKRAIKFAINGMHLDIYFNDKLSLMFYSKYFWYLESEKATQLIAAYLDGKFAGVLVASFKDEKPLGQSFYKKTFVKIMEFILETFFKNSAGEYEKANNEMLEEFSEQTSFDGELVFLAVDPELNSKGIGTELLNELASREKGKRVFLFTDDMCSYQFYEKRGFDRRCERNILLKINSKSIPLKCFLYSRDF